MLGRSAMQLMSVIPGVQPPAGQDRIGQRRNLRSQNGRAECKLRMACLRMAERVARRSTRNHPLRFRSSPSPSFVLIPQPIRRSTGARREAWSTWSRSPGQINFTAWSMSSSATTTSTPIVGRTIARESAEISSSATSMARRLAVRLIRDRTFFFINYEAQRQGTPIDFVSTVPTALQRQGDFSQTLDSTGRNVTIYDPTTTRPDPEQSRQIPPRSIPRKPHSRRSDQRGVEERH